MQNVQLFWGLNNYINSSFCSNDFLYSFPKDLTFCGISLHDEYGFFPPRLEVTSGGSIAFFSHLGPAKVTSSHPKYHHSYGYWLQAWHSSGDLILGDKEGFIYVGSYKEYILKFSLAIFPDSGKRWQFEYTPLRFPLYIAPK